VQTLVVGAKVVVGIVVVGLTPEIPD